MTQTYILIVDDTPQHTLALEAVLADLDQEIIIAHSAEEALKQILKYDFAVILLDVHMPIMNGFEVARLIRSRKKSSYTPIIFLSAINKDDKNINEGYAMGAVDYVFKPIDPVILRSKVKVFVDLYTKSSLAINLQNELRLRKQAEQRTLKQQRQIALTEINRFITIEEITSAMAHEIKQPLTAIQTYVQTCLQRLQRDDFDKQQAISILEQVSRQSERASGVLNRIKNFIRKNNINYENVNLNDLISESLPFLFDTVDDSSIKLNVRLCSDIAPVVALDKIQVEQVLLNIIINCIEALKICKKNNLAINVETLNQSDGKITIVISDNGPGIPENILEKIFDLYFTTKDKGMGLGLSICKTIIENHGGNIIAKNNSHGGARFEIRLPYLTTNTVETTPIETKN